MIFEKNIWLYDPNPWKIIIVIFISDFSLYLPIIQVHLDSIQMSS